MSARVRCLRRLPREQPRQALKLHLAAAGDVRVRQGRLQEGQLRPGIHLLIRHIQSPPATVPRLSGPKATCACDSRILMRPHNHTLHPPFKQTSTYRLLVFLLRQQALRLFRVLDLEQP